MQWTQTGALEFPPEYKNFFHCVCGQTLERCRGSVGISKSDRGLLLPAPSFREKNEDNLNEIKIDN